MTNKAENGDGMKYEALKPHKPSKARINAAELQLKDVPTIKAIMYLCVRHKLSLWQIYAVGMTILALRSPIMFMYNIFN